MRHLICALAVSFATLGGVSPASADVAAQRGQAAHERRPLLTAVPVYPKKARQKRIEGEVVVCYVIDANGRVRSPYVDKSSNRIFNKAALKAIRKTRYEPAAPGAVNARTSSCDTYRFVLTPVERETP